MGENISTLLLKKLFGELTPQEHLKLTKYAGASKANKLCVENYTNKQLVLAEVKLREQLTNEEDWRKIEEALHGKSSL